MAVKYGACALWFPDERVAEYSGLTYATEINPWLESPEGMAWRMEELTRRIEAFRCLPRRL